MNLTLKNPEGGSSELSGVKSPDKLFTKNGVSDKQYILGCMKASGGNFIIEISVKENRYYNLMTRLFYFYDGGFLV